jgi:hypothetical protein
MDHDKIEACYCVSFLKSTSESKNLRNDLQKEWLHLVIVCFSLTLVLLRKP